MVFQALKKVFSGARYAIFAASVSAIFFVFAIWLPNIGLIVKVSIDPEIHLAQKIELPVNLLGAINTNFTPLSVSYTIATAILLGINAAMGTFYLRRKAAEVKAAGIVTGFLGIASGSLGLGCAACGSLILTTTLPLFGAGALLTFLPLGGEEFGILGVVLLSASLYLTAKQIQNPAVCKV